jgi:hypothetical protein
MQIEIQQRFIQQWAKYFPARPLPITFFYADEPGAAVPMEPYKGGHCLIHELARVRAGESLAFEGRAVMCGGGRYFLGFTQKLRPHFNAFLACGIPGQLEGERYKSSPDLVDEMLITNPVPPAAGKMIVFKRWDQLSETDQPQVVIFFAGADTISGLFTLANFDEPGSQAVIAPFGSGCCNIVATPLRELQSEHPRAVLGMFDPSARPWVGTNELTLAIPWPKFVRMLDEMDESFLITPTWEKIRAR